MERIFGIPVLGDNYCWGMLDPSGRRAVVFDPGEGKPVADFLSARGLDLTAICLTHHHRDHTGGIRKLLAAHQVPVIGPGIEGIRKVTEPVSGGRVLELPGVELPLEVIPTPGHTRGHIAYLVPVDGTPALFSGDTLFASGCGRVFEGTYSEMYDSLLALKALAGETLLYCGHEYTLENLRFARAVEPENRELADYSEQVTERRRQGLPTVPTTLATEWRFNPFLRCSRPAVIQSACKRAGKSLCREAEVFEVLRRWKNSF